MSLNQPFCLQSQEYLTMWFSHSLPAPILAWSKACRLAVAACQHGPIPRTTLVLFLAIHHSSDGNHFYAWERVMARSDERKSRQPLPRRHYRNHHKRLLRNECRPTSTFRYACKFVMDKCTNKPPSNLERVFVKRRWYGPSIGERGVGVLCLVVVALSLLLGSPI